MTCDHAWFRNFLIINTFGVNDKPQGAGAEHVCLNCGAREWERLTADEVRVRLSPTIPKPRGNCEYCDREAIVMLPRADHSHASVCPDHMFSVVYENEKEAEASGGNPALLRDRVETLIADAGYDPKNLSVNLS